MERLPNCEGFPHEFVVAREHRNSYDHAVRAAGARLVEIGFHEILSGAGVRRAEAWEYEAAFGPRDGRGVVRDDRRGLSRRWRKSCAARHAHHLPVLVDAAAELPPRANLKALVASGADLVAFSGGKGVRGPQATGILCGSRELVGSAALQMLDMDDHWQLWDAAGELFDREKLAGMPRHGIGRGFKVAKEQIVALLVALKQFASGQYDRELAGFRRRLKRSKTPWPTVRRLAASKPATPNVCRFWRSRSTSRRWAARRSTCAARCGPVRPLAMSGTSGLPRASC